MSEPEPSVSSAPPQPGTDPRRLASVVVQRVGRAPLVLGGTVLLLALWCGAFLLSAKKENRPPGPAPIPAAGADQADPGTRELLQRFLEESRRQAAQDAAAQADRYPADRYAAQGADDFSGYGPAPSFGAQQPEAHGQTDFEPRAESRPAASRGEPARRDASQDRLERALEAPPLVSLSRPVASRAADSPPSLGGLLEATEQLARLAQMPAPPGALPEPGAPAILRASSPSPSPIRMGSASSPFTLAAGSLIPAVLTSAVNSDTPGSVSAVVSHDVFDSQTGYTLLVPAGSRLLGSSGAAAHGQNRLEITWSRLTLPDGTTYELGAMPAADAAGANGLRDRTNRHLARTFGSALLLSAFTAAAQLSQPDSYSGGLRTPSAQEVAAGALGQQINATAGALIDRELRVPPTLVLRPGMGCNVVVTADLVFPGPYSR